MKQIQNHIDIQLASAAAGNKFDLILMAAVRAREISRKKIATPHKYTVAAIQDIQDGVVGRDLLRRVGQRYK
jgi:DNA-directed RNA polymerase omega subunit